MKNFFCLFLLFACVGPSIHAQSKIEPSMKSALYESSFILPSINNKSLLLEELRSQESGRAVKFAKANPTNLNVKNSGLWDDSRANTSIWRLLLESKGALSLNLGFEAFWLPEGAELFIYNEDQSYFIGPLTSDDNDEHRQYWTPIIKDDVLIIELLIPEDKIEELVLELTKINHDYLGFGRSFSGSCNLDVICGEADGFELVEEYRDIIQSVGAYHINGTEVCSGALINNAREDKTPYYLTANHCGITNSNAGTVVAYWNYENSFCRQPNSPESGQVGDGNLSQFNSGAINRASWGASDFNLIEFDDPIRPDHKPYFAGWKNDFESTSIVIGIHHPGVEEKRISFEFDQVNNGNNNFIRVEDWDIGTTEGGSSGSPIFNENKQIIGQLQGGLAACGNDQSDNYGSINAAWLGGGTNDSSLKPWLDPDDLGLTELNGFNGAFGIQFPQDVFAVCNQNSTEVTVDFTVEEGFTDFVNLQFQNLPIGLNITSLDQNFTPGETSSFIMNDLDNITAGNYEIIVISSDGENLAENIFTLEVSDEIPNQVRTISPMNQAENQQVIQEFFWEAIDNAISYDLELSNNADFTDVFTSVNEIQDTEYLIDILENLSTYYWRVRAGNYCGVGEWSETFSFSTSNTYCIIVEAKDLPVIISENGLSQNTSSIFVDYPILVDKVSIPRLQIEHTFLEDLIIILNNPENDAEVMIMSENCSSNENIDAGFDDTGLEDLLCPPIDGNIYQPLTPFRDMVGINGQGRWDLDVFDNYNFDGGQISSWNLELCFSAAEEKTIIPLDGAVSDLCIDADNSLRLYYNLEDSSADAITVETANGTSVPFTYTGGFPLTGSGDLELVVNGTDPLIEGLNELYISLGSGLETQVNVNLISAPETPEITNFTNGETLASLETIDWTESNADLYTVYIAEDAEFISIVWSGSVQGEFNSIEIPELQNGEYFVVVEASNKCGIFSSELYNFIQDESVSITETNLPTLIVGQNITDNSIILSGNSTLQELHVNLISVSGHKLLSQSFHEESLHVDVNALFPGVYFLQINSGTDSTIKKIVIY